MGPDFDRVIDRRNSDSNKWHKFPPDVLPMWVADMDFPSPPVVVDALRRRIEADPAVTYATALESGDIGSGTGACLGHVALADVIERFGS